MPLDALEGFTIGITADRRWEQQADLFRRRGAHIVHGPTMATRYVDDGGLLHEATARVIGGVDAVVVTTGIGVRAWFEAAEAHGQGPDLRTAMGRARILCRGPKAAGALQVAGVPGPPEAQAESLQDLLGDDVLAGLGGRRVAFQNHGAGDRHWIERLGAAGAEVVEVPVYRWELPGSDAAALRLVRETCAGRVHAVTFTSAPAVANMVQVADAHGLKGSLLDAFNRGAVVAGCVGPLCAAGAIEAGVSAPVFPDVGRLGLLVRSVTEELSRRGRRWTGAGVEFSLQGRALAAGGDKILLSPLEGSLLALLADRPGTVVAKSLLARRLGTSPRVVETGIGRLRSRLAPLAVDVVQTLPMRGYRLVAP